MGLPTTLTQIEDEERRVGMTFPNPLKELLVKSNGGLEVQVNGDTWYLFPVKDTSSRKSAIRSANHIERETYNSKDWSGFPENAIAIGENGCGDKLILLANQNGIFVWNHETARTVKAKSFEPYVS